MDHSLQQVCDRFIRNREAVKKVFKAESSAVYPVCANIFTARRTDADEARLMACKKLVKQNAGAFSNFRGAMIAPTASFLSLSDDPAGQMEQAQENYKTLREQFTGGESLALAAIMLTNVVSGEQLRDVAQRGKDLFRRMKQEHRVLTGTEDRVFALLLALSQKSDDAILGEIEACYQALKPMGSNDSIQAAALILVMSDLPQEEKIEKLRALYESLRQAGIPYGKHRELPVLAALSLQEPDVGTLTNEVAEIERFLSEQKGYHGIFGESKKNRYMHAAMLASSAHTPDATGELAALSAMLAAVAAEMAMMLVTVTAAANSASAAAASH